MKGAKETVSRYGLIFWTLLCLISLLIYTFTHTSTLMGRYASPGVGQIAAFGIESSIIGMSIRIGRIMRQLVERPKERALWLSLFWQGGTLLFVLLVTASAQIVEGFEVRHRQPFSVEAVALLDPVLIAVGLLATGVIPALVIALTEIVSGEIRETINGSIAVAIPVVASLPIATPVLPNLLPSLQESAADGTGARDEVATEQPVALVKPKVMANKKPIALPEQETVVEPTLDALLLHFRKTRSELLAQLKQYGMMNAPAEEVYSKLKRYVGLPDSITPERFAVLLAELKAGKSDPAEPFDATGYDTIKAAVFAYMDASPDAKIADLLTAFPGQQRGTLSGNLSKWREKQEETVMSANGRHS